VHGVSDVVDEEPDFVAEEMIELVMWIEKRKSTRLANTCKLVESLSPNCVKGKRLTA
jgi:hypothetical protein